MEPVVGVFGSRSQAEEAAERFKERGVSRVTLLTPGEPAEEVLQQVPTDDMEQPGMAPAIGGLVGGALGLAGGLELGTAAAAILLPGVGPVLAIGMLGAAVLGAGGAAAGVAAGHAVETSAADGLPKDELFFYEDALRQGRSVLIAYADDDESAVAARGIMTLSGAESLDAARESWWLGLRPLEQEHYQADGQDFSRDEACYRHGFEAALHPDRRNQSYTEALEVLRERYGSECDQASFRRGYERGRGYYR